MHYDPKPEPRERPARHPVFGGEKAQQGSAPILAQESHITAGIGTGPGRKSSPVERPDGPASAIFRSQCPALLATAETEHHDAEPGKESNAYPVFSRRLVQPPDHVGFFRDDWLADGNPS